MGAPCSANAFCQSVTVWHRIGIDRTWKGGGARPKGEWQLVSDKVLWQAGWATLSSVSIQTTKKRSSKSCRLFLLALSYMYYMFFAFVMLCLCSFPFHSSNRGLSWKRQWHMFFLFDNNSVAAVQSKADDSSVICRWWRTIRWQMWPNHDDSSDVAENLSLNKQEEKI